VLILKIPIPTSAPPGSLWKMAVLQQRWECGEALYHPDDETEVVRELIHPFPAGNPTHAELVIPLMDFMGK
jgi:Zn-dependent metalloprotease